MRRRELMMGSLACGLLAVVSRAAASECGATANQEGATLSAAQLKRIVEGLRFTGEPLASAEADHVLQLAECPSVNNLAEIESVLQTRTLIRVQLDKHGVGKATLAGAPPQLLELGWRSFLVRVENPARLTGPLLLVNPASPFNPVPIAEGDLQPGIHDSHVLGHDLPEVLRAVPDADVDFDNNPNQWMGYRFGVDTLAPAGLEGHPVEYVLLQLYSQAPGRKSALLSACNSRLHRLRRTECKGFTAEFVCAPASTVTLNIRDWDRAGTTASLIIRDEAGRLYPAPAHRLEPDLGYQPQIYRAHGESIRLPSGRYKVVAARGPEYLPQEQALEVPKDGAPTALTIDLERWIHPAQLGWYPGDPHLHPEGQAYGIVSKLGVMPETMLRQVRGEALSVGSVLIWTGGYYYEKQFLTGRVHEPTYQLPFPQLQRANNSWWTPQRTPHDSESIVRYDVEQAAFPSNRHGHPILLGLKHHEYPGSRGIYEWPSWNLPLLQWARAQGGVTGYAHSGHSMSVQSTDLPNYEIPALDGLGANECLVDVTHGAVDFMAGGENQPIADLNVWYHLLNCGFRIPMVGETDFPGGSNLRRAGSVRTYVGLPSKPDGDAGYEAWIKGIQAGRVYYGDGRSHLLDFKANNRALGEGTLTLQKPGRVRLSVKCAALLPEAPVPPDSEQTPGYAYWNIERARIGASRKVLLEVVVNGHAVERREVLCDGALRALEIPIQVAHSSWIALRILPSVHTAPLIVSVAGRPVRASKRSAQWCLDCIDRLWAHHAHRIREPERAAAEAAWEHARNTYRKIQSECTTP